MRTVFLLLAVVFLRLSVCGQQKTSNELKELFSDADFFLAQESYADALHDYNELYNSGFQSNANINYKIGICYLNMPGQKDKSIKFMLEAVKDVSRKYKESSIKQKSAPVDAWLFLGNAYRVNNKLEDAIAAYTRYKELADTPGEIAYADQQIAACQTARRFLEKEKKIRLTNLGEPVNGPSSNYKGVISGNGKVLVYMNELPFYNAVYFSTHNGEGWTAPININPQIQSDGDQYVSSVSYDGTQLLLTKEDAFNSDIYISHFANGSWSRSIPLQGEDINTKFWESHASLSKDGKKLYFTSNRNGGAGNMDIYFSELRGGAWTKPVNLGNTINTPLNEDTPFVSENDSLLFFSSQGHENMGGYDIFVSVLDANSSWTEPVNLGYPINTTDDDLFYYPWKNNKVGFLSRIEHGGFGEEDIYALQLAEEKDFNVLMAEFINEGSPSASRAEESLPQAKDIAEKSDGEAVPVTTIDESSEPARPTVIPEAKAKAAPAEVVLDPVYFKFDNFQLTEAGKKQLETIKGYLVEYPETRLRLVGHADAMGPDEYNLRLSAKRAGVAGEYLISLGIDASRVETIGLGEKNFVAINSNPDGTDNPEGRRLNRRVEYEITAPEDSPILIRMTPIPENLRLKK